MVEKMCDTSEKEITSGLLTVYGVNSATLRIPNTLR